MKILFLSRVAIVADFHLTMIDGKCLAYLTDTPSMASCPFCQAKPTKLNLPATNFQMSPGSDAYGIQPLHFCICVLNAVLNLSYRLEELTWSVGKKIEARKKVMQERLKREFGVIVDMPRDGGAGTSNTGNVARRLFSQPEKFAETLELDVQLIKNFKTIMIALNCHEEVVPEKFQEICDQIANIYRVSYPWARLSSAVHKVIYHAADVMRVAPLPLGYLSEEGAEAKNKFYRSDRLHHARKIGRIENLQDIFNRSLEMSDPLISMHAAIHRKEKFRPKKFPREVIDLFKHPENYTALDEDESDEECLADLDDFEFGNE